MLNEVMFLIVFRIPEYSLPPLCKRSKLFIDKLIPLLEALFCSSTLISLLTFETNLSLEMPPLQEIRKTEIIRLYRNCFIFLYFRFINLNMCSIIGRVHPSPKSEPAFAVESISQ